MTDKMSPEEIAEMSEDCQCSCKELDRMRTLCEVAYGIWSRHQGPESEAADRMADILNEILQGSTHAHEPLHDETFRSVVKAQADTIGVLARRVVRMGNPVRDHACPQCVPEGGDLVNPGFICAFHLASYLVTCPEYQMPDAAHKSVSMRSALEGLLQRYVSLVNCGDCGDWNPEQEPEMIQARAVLQLTSVTAVKPRPCPSGKHWLMPQQTCECDSSRT